jgi:CubicO group peptidase (beta-lactamase class C family)
LPKNQANTKNVRHQALDRIAQELVIAPGVSPAACVGFSARHTSGSVIRTGAAGRVKTEAASTDTIFDLASVSKPFLAVTVARLVQRGVLTFETPLQALLTEAVGTPCADATIECLLAHRAGLDAHRSLFAPLQEGRALCRSQALQEAANARRADCQGAVPPSGFAPLYSDLGYVLVGEAIARACQLELDELIEREVCGPLGLPVCSARLFRKRERSFVERVAPTETVAWRGGEIRGVVHDENAWAIAGHAAAGQAGLFGTVAGVLAFGAALLNALSDTASEPQPFLSRELAERLIRERPQGSLRAGFDGRSGPTPAAGSNSSSATFGHLGFTGTSMWCDPEAQIVTVLLTNRVCPTRTHVAIRAARPLVHTALFEIAGNPPQGGW